MRNVVERNKTAVVWKSVSAGISSWLCYYRYCDSRYLRTDNRVLSSHTPTMTDNRFASRPHLHTLIITSLVIYIFLIESIYLFLFYLFIYLFLFLSIHLCLSSFHSSEVRYFLQFRDDYCGNCFCAYHYLFVLKPF